MCLCVIGWKYTIFVPNNNLGIIFTIPIPIYYLKNFGRNVIPAWVHLRIITGKSAANVNHNCWDKLSNFHPNLKDKLCLSGRRYGFQEMLIMGQKKQWLNLVMHWIPGSSKDSRPSSKAKGIWSESNLLCILVYLLLIHTVYATKGEVTMWVSYQWLYTVFKLLWAF